MTVLDHVARPRIGLIWDGSADPATAVALRTLELCFLQRLPSAHLHLVCTGNSVGMQMRTVRNARDIDVEDAAEREGLTAGHDLLVIFNPGGNARSAVLEGAARSVGVEVLTVAQAPLEVCELGVRVQEDWFTANRQRVMSALGWLPPDSRAPYVAADPDPALATELSVLVAASPELSVVVLNNESAPAHSTDQLVTAIPPGRAFALGRAAGVDELVATLARAQQHVGGDPLPGAILRGAEKPSPDSVFLETSIEEAARAGLATWTAHGRPGAAPDAVSSRRLGTERAVFQCALTVADASIREARREAEDARTQLAAIVSSRSWRFTGLLRNARRRLGR